MNFFRAIAISFIICPKWVLLLIKSFICLINPARHSEHLHSQTTLILQQLIFSPPFVYYLMLAHFITVSPIPLACDIFTGIQPIIQFHSVDFANLLKHFS